MIKIHNVRIAQENKKMRELFISLIQDGMKRPAAIKAVSLEFMYNSNTIRKRINPKKLTADYREKKFADFIEAQNKRKKTS